MNTEYKLANNALLARAVHEAEDAGPEDAEARVKALLDWLLSTGQVTPAQHGNAFYEEASREHEFVDLASYDETTGETTCTRVHFNEPLAGLVETYEI